MSLRDQPAFWVVIPAAGVGSRMRADRPKQYLLLGERSIIEHTLDCFLDHPALAGLVVCIAPDDPYWPALPCARDTRVQLAPGGRERCDSVLSGLQRLDELGANEHDWVLVHDAARPNLAREDLDRLLAELADDPVGGLLAVPARDTLKRVGPDGPQRHLAGFHSADVPPGHVVRRARSCTRVPYSGYRRGVGTGVGRSLA